MRRRSRLILVLLLISVLYIIKLFSNHETGSTLQNNSVSTLTDFFSASVPTNSRIIIRAAKTNIQVRGKIIDRPKIARNSNRRIRSKVKVRRPDITDRRMSGKRPRKYRKFEKQAKKSSSKTHKAHELVVVEGRTGTGSGFRQNISKVEMYIKTNGHSSTPMLNAKNMTLPNYLKNSRLQNSRKMYTTTPKIQKLPMQIQEQRKVHAKSESRITRVQFRNMSVADRNDGVGARSTQANTRGARVIIVAHGRSGSSFFGGIFNAHPDFFFIYEPLNKLHSIISQNKDDYLYNAEYIIKYILQCNFDDDAFLQMLSHEGLHRASSRPLVSPPFCNTTYDRAINFIGNPDWTLCIGNISADVLNKSCRNKNIAAKILLGKVEPAGLSWILDIIGSSPAQTAHSPESPQEDVDPVHVLYLVRDPRAMLYSRYRLGWVVPRVRHEHGLENGEVDIVVKKVCDAIEQNLGAVLLHPQRIKLVRYEELVSNPEAMIKRLFSELRISPSKEVTSWIHSKTHGPVKMNAGSLSRNATVSINSWREKIPDQLLEIIERRCERVMKYLGYLPTHGSRGLLRDLRKHLYLDKIRDLKENYQWPAM